jgi:hypothetical protein
MSATATTPGRQIRREVCLVHNFEFGQTYVKNDETRESGWFPEFCPKCFEDFAREERWRDEVKRQAEEIAAQADKEQAADDGLEAWLEEESSFMMGEDAGRYVLDFFYNNRAKYKAHAKEKDWNRRAAEISTERRAEFLERIQKMEEVK